MYATVDRESSVASGNLDGFAFSYERGHAVNFSVGFSISKAPNRFKATRRIA
jgi:hypothetical protein